MMFDSLNYRDFPTARRRRRNGYVQSCTHFTRPAEAEIDEYISFLGYLHLVLRPSLACDMLDPPFPDW